ncbi:MAG: tRNA glutamyl-Q(34) synthetase GluQRS [Geothrix sp.]|uniref:tRNA glutamyl-Q(34) synthetase GluQRS n=1 Tax=Geothrix sp. TaxID=1962974 RepID=UPI001810D4EC|nr:tRNA glutamyl-Q(34) synthetase GluQRS [Geothrix sp.]NWJ40769.1 tRNA glutamyl-Q(34) synthetase GluQRS [Geothrix sp.]WIL21225.1 MAG: tRNA glutamyl-Q(34) synthetase GluQRS [Geothrix sp.]
MTLGRFAPSPTGVLHLGNLRTALASWLSARKAGGRWIVRMEDVDGPRCRRDLGEAQLRDLAALGLESDAPVLWQSDRSAVYRETLTALHRANRLYSCLCTRKDLQLLASAPHTEDGLRAYPGRCRGRAWEGFDRALRLRLSDGPLTWEDRLLGAQVDDPVALTGDPLLFRRDGCFAYHLAVVVDDGAQGVTEVVRGADLRSVTATQIRLQEALSLPRPTYAHLGMVAAPDGTRLGKRAGALGLEALAARGVSPAEALGWLGWSLGCLDRPEPCTASDLIGAFDWTKVPKDESRVPTAWT